MLMEFDPLVKLGRSVWFLGYVNVVDKSHVLVSATRFWVSSHESSLRTQTGFRSVV